jgi:RimJ/RimL family protein N-acetyltransferase
MLFGDRVTLRPLRAADLDWFYEGHADLRNRGGFFPRRITSETRIRRDFDDDGLWGEHEGTLVIVAGDDTRVGHIEFYRPINYLHAYELSYLLHDPRRAGKGYVSESVRLLTDYLFETRLFNRVELRIHPDNAASRRIAEKCGYRLDGTTRGAWYHDGRTHDIVVYGRLRAEWEAGRPGASSGGSEG